VMCVVFVCCFFVWCVCFFCVWCVFLCVRCLFLGFDFGVGSWVCGVCVWFVCVCGVCVIFVCGV